MLSCKEISHILASSEELGIIRRMELQMHLLICKHCSNYNKHLKLLRSGMKRLFKKKTIVDDKKIKALEEDILKKISSE